MAHLTRPFSARIVRLVFLFFCFQTISLLQVFPVYCAGGNEKNVAPKAAPQADPAVVRQWSPVIYWGTLLPLAITPIHMSVLPNGKVLVGFYEKDAGGHDVLCTRARVWNPLDGTWGPVASTSVTNIFCSGHTFLPNGRLLVAGGHHLRNGVGEHSSTVFIGNDATGIWINTYLTEPEKIIKLIGKLEHKSAAAAVSSPTP